MDNIPIYNDKNEMEQLRKETHEKINQFYSSTLKLIEHMKLLYDNEMEVRPHDFLESLSDRLEDFENGVINYSEIIEQRLQIYENALSFYNNRLNKYTHKVNDVLKKKIKELKSNYLAHLETMTDDEKIKVEIVKIKKKMKQLRRNYKKLVEKQAFKMLVNIGQYTYNN